ncbi:hypothetical protein Hdeb2414_s0032g00717771 [Helianthus debilis subsp. tardiflorus]
MYVNVDTLWSEVEHRVWNEKPYIKDAPEIVSKPDGNIEIILTRVRTQTKTYTQKLGSVNDNGPRIPHDSSRTIREITPGSMLIATENLAGLYPLDRSRILIVKADQTTGFQGLILNRFIPWDAITPLDERFELLKDAPLSYGGLIVTRGRLLLSLTRQSVRGEHPEVLPGIYFLDQLATFNLRQNLESDDRSVTDYWLFWGYLEWGWTRLYDEIADGKWNVINGTVQQLDWPIA